MTDPYANFLCRYCGEPLAGRELDDGIHEACWHEELEHPRLAPRDPDEFDPFRHLDRGDE